MPAAPRSVCSFRPDCRRERRCARRWRWQSQHPRLVGLALAPVTLRVPTRQAGAAAAGGRGGTRAGEARRASGWGACSSGTHGSSPRASLSELPVPPRLRRAWAGRGGSGRFGCSVAQLVMGLAPIMGWGGLPNRGRLPRDKYLREREAFVERHRASVRRWLDWLELAGLLSHTPQQDEEGVWWRTIIELHPAPEIERELLEAAVDRRAGWPGRERRRRSRGRRRDLTAILRRARLTRAERRARGIERRRRVGECAERQRVAEAVAESLALAAKAHVSHPFGASTTSRTSPPEISDDSACDRGLTGARTRFSNIADALQSANDRRRGGGVADWRGSSLGRVPRGDGRPVRPRR